MTLKFWPPLQLVAYARVGKGILYTFDLEILKENFMHEGFVRTDYIQQIQEKVSAIIVPLYTTTLSHLSVTPTKPNVKNIDLPNQIRKQLVGIIMVLGVELIKWFDQHDFILHHLNLDLREKLVWFSFGIIDCCKTAQNFIQDETLCKRIRFHLACKYYIEDIWILWRCMSITDKFYVRRRLPRTRSMELWLEALNRNTSLDWEQISLLETRYFFNGNHFGIRNYFTKLRNREKRYMCILTSLKNMKIHYFDLYWCLTQINNEEVKAILARLPPSELCKVFESFLHWPFQIMFLDVVNNFKQHINGEIFLDLTSSILSNKLLMGWQDYLYVDLLEHFWKPMFIKYKDVKNFIEIQKTVNDVLKNSKCFYLTEYIIQ